MDNDMISNREYRFIISGALPDKLTAYLFSERKKDIGFVDYPGSKVGLFLEFCFLWSRISNGFPVFIKEMMLRKRVSHFSSIPQLTTDYYNRGRICFLMFEDMLYYEKWDFSGMLRSQFPNAKIVYFFRDIVGSNPVYLEWLRYENKADLIYTYDQSDAKKYGWKWHNLPYPIERVRNDEKHIYDIFFCGRSKNRYEEIIEAFEHFEKMGLKCAFFIEDVPDNKQKHKSKIRYNTHINYTTYLEYLNKSKCVLEITQKNSAGNTLRVNEVICYGKKLVSNNLHLKDNILYDSRYMQIYNDVREIDTDFICDGGEVEYGTVNQISLSVLLEDISRDLEMGET